MIVAGKKTFPTRAAGEGERDPPRPRPTARSGAWRCVWALLLFVVDLSRRGEVIDIDFRVLI